MKRKDAQLLSVQQASSALGVSESTVWRLLRGGALESVHRSGRRLGPRSAVERRVGARAASRALKPLSEGHSLWRLVGAFRGHGQSPGSSDKYGALFDE
jgi:excisionase family DNA binding protein